VDAQPFVKAWPAEEVATERYNRLLWQLKAYVALETTPGISATAAADCPTFAAILGVVRADISCNG
jgi:hypothetical protein